MSIYQNYLCYDVMEKTCKTEQHWKKDDLLDFLDQLHTTDMGADRIRKNLRIDTEDVVPYCCNLIASDQSVIERKGKNWYVTNQDIVITVNAHSYTIITAHKNKRN